MNSPAQHAVIIGGTSGIGLATAQALGDAGMHVTVTGRDHKRLERATELLAATRNRVAGYSVDATDRAALDSFFASVAPVDHVVLAASGAAGAGAFPGLALDDLRAGFEAKFFAHLNSAQAALAALQDQGSLTFVTAISSQTADPGTAGLAAINGALEAMVSTLAVELAPRRVNAVSPGVVDTPWWDFLPEDQKFATFENYVHRAPAGRVGRAEEIAQAVLSLMTNAFITGVVLPCDGGLRLAGGLS